MKFDLESVANPVERLNPWDLVLSLAGVDYETARPSLGTIIELQTGNTNASRLESVKRIFVTPPANLAEWTLEEISAAVALYVFYFEKRIEKNSQPLVTKAKELIAARGSTDGA